MVKRSKMEIMVDMLEALLKYENSSMPVSISRLNSFGRVTYTTGKVLIEQMISENLIETTKKGKWTYVRITDAGKTVIRLFKRMKSLLGFKDVEWWETTMG